jgi:hypothetical protein
MAGVAANAAAAALQRFISDALDSFPSMAVSWSEPFHSQEVAILAATAVAAWMSSGIEKLNM